MKAPALVVLAALALAACGRPPASNPAPKAASEPDTPPSASDVDDALAAAASLASAEARSAAGRAPIVNSSNAFAASLWGVLRGQPGNLVVSPASITTALAMTFGGARGETSAEMKRVLHFEASPEEVTRSAGELLRGWNESEGPTILRAANHLFGESSYTFERPFLDATERAFGAPLELVDFAKSPERARQRINDWVGKETAYRVRDVIPPAAIDGQTRLVMVNAIYFKADWASPFEASRTQRLPFHVTKTSTKDVPTMRKEDTFRFAERSGARGIEIPYKGRDASMVLLVTDAVDGLPALEESLTAAELDRWIDAMRPEEVRVTLPRFEIEPPSATSLRDTLRALGMQLAFDSGKADFTGIAAPKNPRDRLFLHNVFHKAFVRVDEKGTEAAVATAEVNWSGGKPPEPKDFRADHPFLFVLRDTKTGMILFMGRVADPSTS